MSNPHRFGVVAVVGALLIAQAVQAQQGPAAAKPTDLSVATTPLRALLADADAGPKILSAIPALRGADIAQIGDATLKDAQTSAPTQISNGQVTKVQQDLDSINKARAAPQ